MTALSLAVELQEVRRQGDWQKKEKRNVLVIEKRSHIGGNCYDCMDEHGIWIHQYGPHIFHTEMEEVYEFFSKVYHVDIFPA